MKLVSRCGTGSMNPCYIAWTEYSFILKPGLTRVVRAGLRGAWKPLEEVWLCGLECSHLNSFLFLISRSGRRTQSPVNRARPTSGLLCTVRYNMLQQQSLTPMPNVFGRQKWNQFLEGKAPWSSASGYTLYTGAKTARGVIPQGSMGKGYHAS